MKFFSLVVLIFISFGAQAGDPKWIYGGGLDEYKDNKYITAIGEGATTEDARKNAFSRLAEQLKISISSQSNIFKEYQSTSEKFSQKENVNIRITTQVDLKGIEGIKIARRYFQPESNIYYALAVLDKVKNATSLSFKIENQIEHIRSQLQQAKKLLESGEASDGIIMLLKADDLFIQITKDIELHRLFADSGVNSLLKDATLKLIAEFDQYLGAVFKQLGVNTLGEKQKTGSPELGVSEPYRVVFTYQGRALMRIPVSVVPDVEAAVIDHDETTDLQGVLDIRVRSLPYTGKQENKIRVKLDLNDDLFIHSSPYAELVVLLNQKSEISIQLKTNISSRSGDYLNMIVNDGLASVLSSQNYNVLNAESSLSGAADYVVEVQGSVIDFPGFNDIKFAKINGVISITSGKTRRTLKTIRINTEATKAGALTSDSAAEKSAGKVVKAVKDELLNTLEMNLGRD